MVCRDRLCVSSPSHILLIDSVLVSNAFSRHIGSVTLPLGSQGHLSKIVCRDGKVFSRYFKPQELTHGELGSGWSRLVAICFASHSTYKPVGANSCTV